MTTKHTPGPWHVCTGDARFVAMPGIVRPINCGNRAHARLIALAPEVLALLRAVDRCGPIATDDVNTGHNVSLLDWARALLARLDGKEG